MPHDYDDDLEGFLIENEEGRTIDGKGADWQPQNDADAEYALANLKLAHAEVERVKGAAKRQMDRIKDWQETRTSGPKGDVKFWEEKLIGYRKRLERDNPKMKATYQLPSGVIKCVAGQASVVVEDELAFFQWALANDTSLIRISPAKDEIARKPHLKTLTAIDALKKTARDSPTGAQSQLIDMSTGERVPGVKVEIGPTSYSAKPT